MAPQQKHEWDRGNRVVTARKGARIPHVSNLAAGKAPEAPQALPRFSGPMDDGGTSPDLVGVPQRDAGTSEAAAKLPML